MNYSFEPFLQTESTNWFADDSLLERLLRRYADGRGRSREGRLLAWGEICAGRLRVLAEESARPENHPRLRHFDAHDRRVDEVVLPASTLSSLAEVEGRQGLGAVHGDPFEFYAQGYLFAQNGEAGVACSMACTDGLVRVLEAVGERPEHREAVDRVRASDEARVVHGAQFVTEIQGGSDVPANRTRAVPEGTAFRLHGQKWFCSNINADYFLVTARPDDAPEGGAGVGLFLVPARLEEGSWRRNGYTIDRLKEKLGTCELATAEVTFDGALAHPIGDLGRGLPHLLSYVLTPSRFACVSFAASALQRARRIGAAYTGFRTAFGRSLIDFQTVRYALEEISTGQARALASLFGLLALWEKANADTSDVAAATEFRIMLSLAKPVHTRRATALLHDAILLLGGNGIEERFSPLPRLYRDAIVMETWEGPHGVLLDQALRDMVRFEVDPAAFVERLAGEHRPDLARELGAILSSPDGSDVPITFSRLAGGLVDAFSDRLLGEL
jgi:alkylation response protein AidB-like acyl-CoA dehydrogenase